MTARVLFVTLSRPSFGRTIGPVNLLDSMHKILLGFSKLVLETKVIVLLLDLVYVGTQFLLHVHYFEFKLG